MPKQTAVELLAAWYLKYVHLRDNSQSLIIALWTAATQTFESFDAFPYLVITARVKRAGKTRLAELVSFTCNVPAQVAGASAASLYRMLEDDKPTIIWDEAETLNSESASIVRAFLNIGYRKGQTIPRVTGEGVKQWPTYCPKVFVLIGDVYDTLRDRSIVIEMQRVGINDKPLDKFSYERVKAEGLELHDMVRAEIADNIERIQDEYLKADLPFLQDRDEELWRPLFAIARALKINDETITRLAADIAAEKTAPARSHSMLHESEDETREREFAAILLRDLISLCGKEKTVWTHDALKRLHAIPTAPWRKYLGTGLTADHMGALLARYRISPKPIRVTSGKTNHTGTKNSKVLRGYVKSEMEKALKGEQETPVIVSGIRIEDAVK